MKCLRSKKEKSALISSSLHAATMLRTCTCRVAVAEPVVQMRKPHSERCTTTLAGDANADILATIIECLRERVLRGARTFMVKIKVHRGEPLNEKAYTQAENARQLSPE